MSQRRSLLDDLRPALTAALRAADGAAPTRAAGAVDLVALYAGYLMGLGSTDAARKHLRTYAQKGSEPEMHRLYVQYLAAARGAAARGRALAAARRWVLCVAGAAATLAGMGGSGGGDSGSGSRDAAAAAVLLHQMGYLTR